MSKKISRWAGPLAVGVLCATLFGSALAPRVKADERDQRTVVTVDRAIEVPGAVLPAGTYIFKLVDPKGDRKVVEVFNADESHVIASFIGVPIYRETPSGQTILRFDESVKNAPQMLRTWFYPSENYGLRFVYPQNAD